MVQCDSAHAINCVIDPVAIASRLWLSISHAQSFTAKQSSFWSLMDSNVNFRAMTFQIMTILPVTFVSLWFFKVTTISRHQTLHCWLASVKHISKWKCERGRTDRSWWWWRWWGCGWRHPWPRTRTLRAVVPHPPGTCSAAFPATIPVSPSAASRPREGSSPFLRQSEQLLLP